MPVSEKPLSEFALSLMWNTTRPDFCSQRSSSDFCFMDSVWRLRLQYGPKLVCGDNVRYGKRYTIHLDEVNRIGVQGDCRIMTHVESAAAGGFISPACLAKVSGDTDIWSFDEEEVAAVAPNFCSDGGKWRIVCILSDFEKETLCVSQKKTTIRTLDPVCLDFHPDFESLSLDFSNLLECKVFSDVEFRCRGCTFSAHKAILAARCKAFADETEFETAVVDIEDLEPQILDLLLKYLYTGKIESVSDDNMCSLYLASEEYGVEDLNGECFYWMIKHLTKYNCVRFLSAADAVSDQVLKDEVISYIFRNVSVLMSDSWLEFTKKPSKVAIEIYRRYVTDIRNSRKQQS